MGAERKKMNASSLFRIISIFLYVILAIIVWKIISINDALSEQWMDTYVRSYGNLGILIYVFIVTILITMGVPRQICSILGGYVFGLWQGTLWATLATALACIACFTYARFLGQELINKKYGHRLENFNDFLCQSPFLLSLVVRIVPLGSNFLTNFLAGVSRIPAKSFLGGSIIGFTVQNFIFALMGSGLHTPQSTYALYSVALYIVSLLLGYWVYLRYKNFKNQKKIDIIN